MADLATFYQKLAARLGVPVENVTKLLSQWQPYEGGWTKNSATFNPINTTEDMPGSHSMNDLGSGHGVQAYRTLEDGVEATAKTLLNGRYPHLVNALHTGVIDARIAPDVRTWTSGKPDGHSNFADLVEGRGDNGAESWAGGSSVTNGRALAADTVSAGGGGSTVDDNSDYDNGTTGYIISTIGQPPKRDDPKYAVDANGNPASALDAESNYLAALKQWGDTAVSLGRSYQLTHPTKSIPNPNALTRDDLLAQQDITNANNAGTLQHYQNQDEITKAQGEIDAFYKGRSDSVARQSQIAAGQKELSAYGVPKAGAQDLSYNDLGRGQYAKDMGYDPASVSRHILGTQWIDPQGDMAANDNLLGVSGKPPSGANLLTGDGYTPSATPPPVSLADAVAGLGPQAAPSGPGAMPPYGANLSLEQTVGTKPNAFNGGAGSSNNLLTGPAAKVWNKPAHMFQWG